MASLFLAGRNRLGVSWRVSYLQVGVVWVFHGESLPLEVETVLAFHGESLRRN